MSKPGMTKPAMQTRTLKTATNEPGLTVFLMALMLLVTGFAQKIDTAASQLDLHGLFIAIASLAHWLLQWLA